VPDLVTRPLSRRKAVRWVPSQLEGRLGVRRQHHLLLGSGGFPLLLVLGSWVLGAEVTQGGAGQPFRAFFRERGQKVTVIGSKGIETELTSAYVLKYRILTAWGSFSIYW